MKSGIRLEDLGKMMLKEAPKLKQTTIEDILNEFFKNTKNSMYLLYAREINYFTMIKNTSFLETGSTKKFIDFTLESNFYVEKDENTIINSLSEIVEMEYNKKINAVEIWVGQGNPIYFQLMPWDDSTVII